MSESAAVRLVTVVIDSTRPRQLAEFWMAVLGVGVSQAVPGDYFIWLEPTPGSGVRVAVQMVEDLAPASGRLHLDLAVPDVAAARERIESLGGTHVADHEWSGFGWTIMADPEGNAFCIAGG